MLESTIKQTGKEKIIIDENNWRQLPGTRIEKVDFLNIVKDVEPFLEIPEEVELITKSDILKLIRKLKQAFTIHSGDF